MSATLAGVVIEHFGYAVPFYVTAALYATAAGTFWAAFRNVPEQGGGGAAERGGQGPARGRCSGLTWPA